MLSATDLSTARAWIPPQADSGGSLRETVNHLIDSLLATFARLLDLPVAVLLAVVAVIAACLWLLARRSQRSGRRPALAAALRVLALAVAVFGAVAVFDHRMAQLQGQIDRLRMRADATTAAILENLARPGPRRTAPLVDVGAARTALAEHFPRFELRASILNDAIDLVRAHFDDPPIEAFLAVVDLRSPRVSIELGATLEHKTRTSDFARSHGCALAINGEAGNSPRPDCGFGPWIGHLMRRGEVLLREQPGNPRPFLWFDAQRRVHFVAGSSTPRELPSAATDAIWGRVDCIVDGEVETDAFRFNQPRTVMGVDAQGERLFLLVVDGRQPQWSYGFTRPQAGWFLAAFGVQGAMLCDEGGSSCMFVREFGGLVNVPSDDGGVERPTYTHFGIVLRD